MAHLVLSVFIALYYFLSVWPGRLREEDCMLFSLVLNLSSPYET